MAFNRNVLNSAFLIQAILLPAMAFAEDSKDTFTYPAGCEAKKELEVSINVPCEDAAAKARLRGKNIGLTFVGPGGASYSMQKFDRLVTEDADSTLVCTGVFVVKDRSKIEAILRGKYSPRATVAPGNGTWLNYSGLAVDAEVPEGSSMGYSVFTEGEDCGVDFTMGSPRKTADMYAAGLSSAYDQCKAEYDKSHPVANKDEHGYWAKPAAGGKNRQTDEASIVGACKQSVANVARVAGSSSIECHKTLGEFDPKNSKPGEQADPDQTGGGKVMQCKDKAGKAYSDIHIKADGDKVVGQAQDPVKVDAGAAK